MKIAIFCGGPSSEHEVSLNSAATIAKHINRKKYEVFFFYISRDKQCVLVEAENVDLKNISATTSLLEGLKDIKEKRLFALLAGIHGEFVEDGQLQTLLDFFEIPYSGSSSKASSLCMDKYHTMQIVKNIPGVLTPQTIITKSIGPTPFHYPKVIKPNSLGSSVGLFIAGNLSEEKNAIKAINSSYGQEEILIQELIDGIEIQCGVLQKKNGEFILLPPIEIQPLHSSTFDYDAKYTEGGAREITPPISISNSLSQKVSQMACDIHKELGCATYSRTDFIVKEDKIYFLEINTLPGMTSTSLLPQEANAIGIQFPELINFIIKN